MKKEISLFSIIFRLGIWLALAAVLFITAAAIFSDYRRVIALIGSISPAWLVFVILSVLFNYVLRFAKWNYFLRILHISVPLRLNLWVFFSAFTMVLSPAKLGELVKSLLLKARLDIPVAATAPVVMAERLTDLAGLLILCALGFSQFAFGGNTLLITSLIIGSGIVIITRSGFWKFVDRALALHTSLSRFRNTVRTIESGTRTLLTLKSLLVTVPLSAVSWAGEGVALYLIFRAMGLDSENLLAIAVFAHSFASIAGALSFFPGGLLVTEGTMGMFFVYASIPDAVAVSATFLIRALTLWFAVILGTMVFFIGHRRSDLQVFRLSAAGENAAATVLATPDNS
ncbi:MAG: lysylphosphatidylglycerol synthase transmembrane domain-containing protein [Candidatus Riflebacteria bacterium]|nr:lysylphosphatidylglycerol synthase transmembrane domain-containing protein [Candidatus Riflebacteria bacterium]